MNVLIIFDLDGTIADTREDLANAVNLARNDFGLGNLSIEEVVNYVGEGKHKLIQRCFKDNPDADIQAAVEKFSLHYSENLIIKTSLYKGVTEGLAALKGKNCFLAVCSNKPGELCRKITSHFGLDKYLITTIGSGDTLTLKPEPEGVLEIIKKAESAGFRRDDNNTWMVGDHHTDLKVAETAGLRSIFCRYGFGFKNSVLPDFEVDDFSEIESIIS